MGSGVSHLKTTAMSSDKHLRDLLLEKTSEIQRLKSDNERYTVTCTYIYIYVCVCVCFSFIRKSAMCCYYHAYISAHRLRKLASDYEEKLRHRDVLNKRLARELDTMKKDADVQAKTIRELKEILQTHVNPPGPAQLRHRAGYCNAYKCT